MNIFEVMIQIETDGDFSYEGKHIKLAIAPNFESAVQHIKDRIQNIIDTIRGKESVISEVKQELTELLERFEKEVDYEEEEYSDEFDIGNQTGFFEIKKLKETFVDGIRTYIRL